MKIQLVYKTSAGYFTEYAEAMKKSNRPQVDYGRMGQELDREMPKQVYVLEDFGLFFELRQIAIAGVK